jgi:hypothetical protein
LPRARRKSGNGRQIMIPVHAAAPEPQNVAIEYIKGQLFRVVHADGAIGSITPSGNVHIAFYSERAAIPRMMVHPRNENGTLGPPIPEQTVTRPGLIREMDVDVVMGPAAVDALITWLQERRADLAKWQEMHDAALAEANKK